MDTAHLGTRPYRLGAFLDGTGWVEHVYGRVWERQPDRLAVAPDHSQIDLILRLASTMPEPFQIAYVLLVPREHQQNEGRFELREPLNFQGLSDILHRYRELL